MTNSTIAATTRPTASPLPKTSGIAEAMDEEKSTSTPSTGVEVNAAMRASLVSAGDGGLGGVEHHRGDRGAVILGHEAHARREVEQRGAGLELVGLGREPRRGGIDLGLVLADGRPAGVDVRLAVGELLRARVDLGLLVLDGRLAGVQLLLAGDRAWPPGIELPLARGELGAAGVELLLVGGDRRVAWR